MPDSKVTIRVWHPDGELITFKDVATYRIDEAGVLHFVLNSGTEEKTTCPYRVTKEK